jgi:hypothetical protein
VSHIEGFNIPINSERSERRECSVIISYQLEHTINNTEKRQETLQLDGTQHGPIYVDVSSLEEKD